MKVTHVLAALAVKDIHASETWWADVLGPADAHPMDGLVEWHFADGQSLQLIADAERAGGSLATLIVDELGADVQDRTTSGAGFRTLTDPDGNAVTLLSRG